MVLIPAFAVGRTQELLFYIHQLKQQGDPDLPVFLDSPMAIDASELLCRFASEHRLSASQARAVCATATYVREREESIALNARTHPMIIISASGMATGGRVLHHLKARAGNPRQHHPVRRLPGRRHARRGAAGAARAKSRSTAAM